VECYDADITKGEKMNTRKLLVSVLMLVSVLLASCAPTAIPPMATVPTLTPEPINTGSSSTNAIPPMATTPTLTPYQPTTTAITPESPVEFVWALPAGSLSYPKHLAVDRQGNIFVPDSGHDRLQKIDTTGKLLMSWGETGSGEGQFIFICLGICPPACPPIPAGWPRCFHLPSGGVAVDEQENVFVSDFNGRIQKFDSNGNFLIQWGSRGTGEGQFLSSPDGLAIDEAGNVYAADPDNHRIQKFDNQGNFLMAWGKQGSGEGDFLPVGIAVDHQGHVYVSDPTGIQKFDSNGKFLTQWGGLSGPEGVAVDSQGHVYVVDNAGARVLIFDGNGNFLGQWGSSGTGDGEFSSPTGIGIDGEDNIYIAERLNHRIQKFRHK
jgi:tripartite motif-containing protein 71